MAQFLPWFRSVKESIDDLSEETHADGTKKFSVGGSKFLTHMVSMYVGIIGFAFNTCWIAVPVMLQKMGVSSERGQLILSTTTLPWSLKSLYAVMSDGVPVLYYKKKYYMLLFTGAGLACGVSLSFLPYSVLSANGATLTLAFVMVYIIMVSLNDSLTQGKYTQIAKSKGSSIIVLKSGMQTMAGFVVALYGGYLNDQGDYGPQYLIMSGLPWVAFAFFAILLNFMGDERLEEPCTPDKTLARAYPWLFVMAVLLGIVTIFNASFSFIAPDFKITRIAVTNIAVAILLVVMFYASDTRIAKINVYLYFCRLCTFGLQFPLQQFYTTDPRDCPRDENGELMNLPNFPFIIFNTVGGICMNGAVLVALYLFERYIVHWNARPAFWVTTAFQVVAGFFDIINTTRFNQTLLSWTGLGDVRINFPTVDSDSNPITRVIRADDLSSYLLGTALLEPLIRELDNLPSTLLLSKLCPKGIETTMFAILVGFFNLGFSISGQVGAMAVAFFGFNFAENPAHEMDPTQPKLICDMGGAGMSGTGKANYMNGMFWTLLIGNICLPFATIPLTWVFIPDKRLDEDFLEEGEDSLELAEGPAESGQAPLAAGGSGARQTRSTTALDENNVQWQEARASMLRGGSSLIL